jgi:hypothetical protein
LPAGTLLALHVIVEFVTDVTLHDSPSIVMSTFDGDIEPVAAKF